MEYWGEEKRHRSKRKRRAKAIAFILSMLLVGNIVSDALITVKAEPEPQDFMLPSNTLEDNTSYQDDTAFLASAATEQTNENPADNRIIEYPETQPAQDGKLELVTEEPKIEEPKTEETITKEPESEEKSDTTETDTIDTTITEESKAEESRTEESRTEESKTEETVTQKAETEESETEKSGIEQTQTQTEEAQTEETVTEEAETEETTTEEILLFAVPRAAAAADQTVTFQVSWADSNNAAGKRPAMDAPTSLFTLYDDSGNAVTVDEANMAITEVNYATWSVAIENVAAGTYYLGMSERTDYKTTYDIESKNYSTAVITNQYLAPIEGELIWKDGDSETIKPSNVMIQIFKTTDPDTPIITKEVSGVKNNDTWTFSYQIEELPAYDTGGADIRYLIKIEAATIDIDSGDYFEVTYDNGEITSDTTSCHNGGSIVLTLRGTAAFSGTKKWLDDGDTAAKEARAASNAALALWRYPKRNSYMWQQGSPVKKSDGTALTYKVGTEAAENPFTIDNFAGGLTWPKYDEDGYPYVYFVKETIQGDYRQSIENTAAYTSYDNTGTILFDGGVIQNIRSKDMEIPIKIIWHAKATSYAWENMPFEVVLERTLAGTSDWASVAEPTVTKESEQEYTYTVPMFDENGKAYTYRAQTVVMKVSDLISKTLDYSASGSLNFKINDAENYHYESELTSTGLAGSYAYQVENRLRGSVVLVPIKRWKGNWNITGDIELNYAITRYANNVKDETFGSSGTLAVTSTPHSTNSLSGATEWIFTHAYTEATVSVGLAEHIVAERFSSEGYEYTYYVKETGPDLTGYVAAPDTGYYTETYYQQGADIVVDGVEVPQYQLIVDNISGNDGKVIEVEKIWKDDGDIDHRGVVKVGLYRVDDTGQIFTKVDSAASITLTAGNQWKGRIGIPSSDNYNDYIVLEESITENSKVGEVVYTAPSSSCISSDNFSYQKAGTVSAQHHKYEVSITSTVNPVGSINAGQRTYYTIKNLRVGKLDITVSKTWKDGTSGKTIRPTGVTFSLKRSGVATGLTKELIPDVTLSNKVQTITDAFTDLDKYDDEGAVYTYEVEETMTGVNADSIYKNRIILEETHVYEPYTTADKDEYTASVTNYREEYDDIWVDVIWRDASKTAARPDIYLTILRHTEGDKEDSWVTQGYVEPQWKVSPVHADGSDYHLRCTFQNMPRYDAEGRRYTYAFVETITANAGLYKIYAYSDNVALVHADGKEEGFCKLTQDKADTNLQNIVEYANVTKEGGTIVNCISADVRTQGVKTWLVSGSGVTDSKKLPKVELTLKRKLKTQNRSEYVEIAATDTNKVTLDAGESAFTFENLKASNVPYFPKYDEFGREYDYTVTEKFVTGDATQNDILNLLYPDNETHRIFDELTFGLQNVLDTKYTRTIVVEKKWENYPTTGTYACPYAHFILHRYQNGAEATTMEKVNEVKLGQTGTIGTSSITKEYSFTNLQVYAPNGKKYVYVVEEDISFAPSYEVTAVSGDFESASDAASGNKMIKVLDVTDLSPANASSYPVETDKISVTNTYINTTFHTITGTVTWEDYSNAYRSRPSIPDEDNGIILELTRETEPQSGVGNPTNETIATGNYTVTWAHNTAANTWTYTIKPNPESAAFPLYAPNGKPWTYKVKEKLPDAVASNYRTRKNKDTVSAPTSAVASNVLTMSSTLVNELYKTITIHKEWRDADNTEENSYGLRPTSVTYQVTVRKQEEESGTGLNVKTTSTPGEIILTDDGSGNWSASTAVLPQYYYTDNAGSKEEYLYCITESVPASYVCVPDDTSTSKTLQLADNPVNFINEVKGSSIKVLIKFDQDFDNAYDTRPEKLEVVLMRRIAVSEGVTPGSWEVVKKTADSLTPVTYVIERRAGTEKEYYAELTNLPVESGTGNVYEYCVVAKDSIDEVSNTYWYGYTCDTYQQADAAPEAENLGVDTYIYCTLPKVDVSVKKIWADERNQDGKRPEYVTVELLCDSEPMMIQGEGTEKEQVTIQVGAQPDHSYQWEGVVTGLPKYKNDVGDSLTERNYSIAVDPLPSYETTISGFDITSTYMPETGSLKLTKKWDDFEDHFAQRPNSITLYLKAAYDNKEYYAAIKDGTASFYTEKHADTQITLSSGESWMKMLSGLPLYRNETGTETQPGASYPITYSLEEIEVPQYTKADCEPEQIELASVSAAQRSFVLTNVYGLVSKPRTLEVTLKVTDKNGTDLSTGRFAFRLAAEGAEQETIRPDTLQYYYVDAHGNKTAAATVGADGILNMDLADAYQMLVIDGITQGMTVTLTELGVETYLTEFDYTRYQAGIVIEKVDNCKDLTASVTYLFTDKIVTSARVDFRYAEAANIISIANTTTRAETELPPLGGKVEVTTYSSMAQINNENDRESVHAAAPSVDTNIVLKWTPYQEGGGTNYQQPKTWGTGNVITITVQKDKDNPTVVETFTYERDSNGTWTCIEGNDENWQTSYGLSGLTTAGSSNIVSEQEAGLEGTLTWTVSNIALVPYNIHVDVAFVPTLVVENVTDINQIDASTGVKSYGGKVRTQTSSPDSVATDDKYDIADGGAEDTRSTPRYLAETKVYGIADTDADYVVDMQNIVIGLPETFSALKRSEVDSKFDSSARGILTYQMPYYGADTLPDSYVLKKGNFHVVFAYDGREVPINGTVSVTKTNAKGFPVEVEVLVSNLLIPLDVGIPFITQTEASRRQSISSVVSGSANFDNTGQSTASLITTPLVMPSPEQWLPDQQLQNPIVDTTSQNREDTTPQTGDMNNRMLQLLLYLGVLFCAAGVRLRKKHL